MRDSALRRDDSLLPAAMRGLRLPMAAAPLFIVSGPDPVVARCTAGMVGSFPAPNAREGQGEAPLLEAWRKRGTGELDRHNQAHPDRPAAHSCGGVVPHDFGNNIFARQAVTSVAAPVDRIEAEYRAAAFDLAAEFAG